LIGTEESLSDHASGPIAERLVFQRISDIQNARSPWAAGRFYLVGVAVLPGVRWPVATGFLNEEIHKLYTLKV